MAEITLEKVKALLADPYFTREMVEQKIQETTGINLNEITKGMMLSDDEYANLLYEKLIELKRKSDELKEKFSSNSDAYEIKIGDNTNVK